MHTCKNCGKTVDWFIAYGLCYSCHDQLCNGNAELITYFKRLI